MSSQQHIIEANDLHFAYRKQEPVLRGAGLKALAGRFICVLGPNGSGKTTLLKCLLGLLSPTSGSIVLDGKTLSSYSHKSLAKMLAYVPQFPSSAFAFPVRELVLMGRYAHTGGLGLAGEDDLAVAKLAMEMTETLGFADRMLEELSGGEAQGVMIARALAQQPSVMLLDEPTSHLDIRNQLKIYRMMQRLAHEWKMAVICVSHDINLAGRFADELVLMKKGQVIAGGVPVEVVREDVLKNVYDVEIELVPDSTGTVPIVCAR